MHYKTKILLLFFVLMVTWLAIANIDEDYEWLGIPFLVFMLGYIAKQGLDHEKSEAEAPSHAPKSEPQVKAQVPPESNEVTPTSSAAASGPVRPTEGPGRILEITPETANWTYLSFSVLELDTGTAFDESRDGQETAIVPLSGAGEVHAGGEVFELARSSVFAQKPHIVYVPPGVDFHIETSGRFSCAVGSAPAEGRLPLRLFRPDEMRSEIRGGGAAHRQVVHALASPLPAERLILYEVYVPRGTWSGWPPHCHDGRDGSPYLEEVYYFRLDRPEGYAHHRNWRDDERFDETLVINDGDVALVPKGYHTSVACPGSNMFFLNYLAGELQGEERATPPCFAAEHTWIEADWTAGEWGLPVVTS